MAKKRTASNQIAARPQSQLPEYGELVSIMQNETASIITDFIRQYIGVISSTSEPGTGIFLNWDRVLRTQADRELIWYDLYRQVELDPHINAVMHSARLNVAGMPWDVFPYIGRTEKKASARNQAIADFVKDALLHLGYFPQHMFNLMDALGKGFAVSEILWNVSPSGVVPATILNRPQRRFQFDAVDRSLRLRTMDNPYFGTSLPERKFIVHRCSSEWDNPFGDALDQSIYWMWLFKNTVTKFWMQHLEVGAASVPIVEHPASANTADKAEALLIAQMIRNGAFGRIPDNFKILWAEAGNAIASAEAYQAFIRFANDEITKCVNGQTLTMEGASATGMGTHALGKVHQTTQTARDMYRASGLAATLNATLIKWTTDFNFSGVDGYPEFRFDVEEPDDLVKESTVVKNLSDSGYVFDEEEISEKFGYTLTRKAPAVPVIGTIGNANPNPSEEPPKNEGTPMQPKAMARILKEFSERISEEQRGEQERIDREAAERTERMQRLEASITEMAERRETDDRIERAIVNLAEREIVVNVAQPEITVAPAQVYVPAPVVNVPTLDFSKMPQIVVNVPEQKPPTINVTVDKGPKKWTVERDGQGYTKSIKGE
jgi:phage gp29-like protein